MFLRKAGKSFEADLKDYGMLTILNRHWNDTIANSFFFALYIGCIALKSLSWFACITLKGKLGKVHWAKFIFPPFSLYSASVVLFCTTLLAASVNKESATFLAHCSARADHRDRSRKDALKVYGRLVSISVTPQLFGSHIFWLLLMLLPILR